MLRQSSIGKTSLERKDSLKDEYMDKGRRSSTEILSKASPFGQMLEAVMKLASSKSLWVEEMQRDLPKKWEKHGDMIVFPQNSFTHVNWRYIGRDLWKVVADSLKIARLGRKRQIADDNERTPYVDILYGVDGWVEYQDERGIRFIYDASKRVFNNAKNREMQRIAGWDCHGETIVDMYAGLGYYTFPFLLTSHAKEAYAIDWDEDMAECLVRTATANNVMDKLTVVQGDARRVTPTGVADRVYLGLVPSCRAHWLTACKALKPQGGMLHIHDTIEVAKKKLTKKEPLKKITKKKQISKLQSVDEESSSGKENKPIEEKPITNGKSEEKTENGCSSDSETPAPVEYEEVSYIDDDGERKTRLRRKFSRSASIVEEMESRVFPDPIVHKEFEESAWSRLDDCYKEYAMDCAVNCTRFLNNINLTDVMYRVVIINLTKYGSSNPKTDNIVLDLLCCLQTDSVEKLAAQFTSKNLA